MDPTDHPTATCHVCGGTFARADLVPQAAVRPGLSALIAAEAPGWAEGRMICQHDLAAFRRAYIEALVERGQGELGAAERTVVDSFVQGSLVSRNPEDAALEQATLGDRIADRVADFGGSWTFILAFLAILFGWIAINVAGVLRTPFDPYPFILLNLVLSCIAAFQAPVIMMSQRRQERKDRLRAETDYLVNLKAEVEIRQLHEKLDHQLARQWDRLAELHRLQIDLIEERVRGRG